MIHFIEGEICERHEGYIVVNCNSIGYLIFVSNYTLSLLAESKICKIQTYLQVKEDGLSLFGFYDIEEKEMFLKLITVGGIGPKVAMGILSGINLNELKKAIKQQDMKMLCTIKGLGKKTAERLIVELKDANLLEDSFVEQPIINQNAVDEATDALISLGVGRNEAYRLAKLYGNENSVEEIITKVLRGMNR